MCKLSRIEVACNGAGVQHEAWAAFDLHGLSLAAANWSPTSSTIDVRTCYGEHPWRIDMVSYKSRMKNLGGVGEQAATLVRRAAKQQWPPLCYSESNAQPAGKPAARPGPDREYMDIFRRGPTSAP